MSESLNAVSSVERCTDLLVGLDKPLEFSVKLNILTSKNMPVMGISSSSSQLDTEPAGGVMGRRALSASSYQEARTMLRHLRWGQRQSAF